MANSFQDLSQMLTPMGPTFPPQVLAASGNGNAVRTSKVGVDRINAQLIVGDATALTSLNVKMQAAASDATGAVDGATWVDITGAVFTAVTADAGAASVAPETIQFQLPRATATGARPYEWVRAVATLVGTNIAICVNLLGCARYDGAKANVNAPGSSSGNNIVN